MISVKKKGDFEIVFDSQTQAYSVYYKDKFLIGNKYKFSDVQSYVN